MENLTDRQTAVWARLDWKYALGLELDDLRITHSVLNEFRKRLLGERVDSPGTSVRGITREKVVGEKDAADGFDLHSGAHAADEPAGSGGRSDATGTG